MTSQMTKFAPQHVNPELAALAVRYVQQYAGDFHYLVDMRNRVARMGEKSLSRYMVKGVLNCMLHDPNVDNLPHPGSLVFDAEEEIEEVRVTRRRRYRVYDAREDANADWELAMDEAGFEEEEVGPSPYRRIEMRSRWKFDYGISDHAKACRVHIIDPTYPAVRWYPGGTNPGDTTTDWTNPWVELRLKWLCKTAWSMGRSPRYELFDHEAAWKLIETSPEWDWCATCQRIEEKQHVLSNRKSGQT